MSYIAKNGRLYTSGASEALTLLDDKFSVNKSYSKGDSCIYNDYLWKFTSDKPAGEWDNSVVEQCRVMDFVSGSGKGATHIGQIILSTTLDTVDKVIELYDGEWEPFGAGQVLVGAGTIPATKEGEENRVFTAGNTGGEYEHTLTVDEMPSHTHTVTDQYFSRNTGWQAGTSAGNTLLGNTSTTRTTSANGSGLAHNNMQPYVVVYMWHRIA